MSNEAGFDVEPYEMDLSDRKSILGMIARAQEIGQITALDAHYLVAGTERFFYPLSEV